jgi:hypothetical protein
VGVSDGGLVSDVLANHNPQESKISGHQGDLGVWKMVSRFTTMGCGLTGTQPALPPISVFTRALLGFPASPHLALAVADILEAKPSSIVAERLIGR